MIDMLIEFSKDYNFKPITQEQFEQWRNLYTFDGLRNLRYGQSFCNYFDINDNILYYTMSDPDQAHQYISKNYIR